MVSGCYLPVHMVDTVKPYIYFGIFNKGKCLFRIWGTIPKTEANIAIANGLIGYIEPGIALRPGDYIAFDYVE